VCLWNVVGYPAGVIPVTEVLKHEEEEVYVDDYNDMITKPIQDDIGGSAGLPIAVQVVSRPNQEELALKGMKVIENVIGYQKSRRYARVWEGIEEQRKKDEEEERKKKEEEEKKKKEEEERTRD